MVRGILQLVKLERVGEFGEFKAHEEAWFNEDDSLTRIRTVTLNGETVYSKTHDRDKDTYAVANEYADVDFNAMFADEATIELGATETLGRVPSDLFRFLFDEIKERGRFEVRQYEEYIATITGYSLPTVRSVADLAHDGVNEERNHETHKKLTKSWNRQRDK